ncbi:hypothetical protein M911_01585 [Ectothiorhodospira haloalkaliphila]|uniref:Uncharacterized protein n=1 Tax=Ectothiorhodospira haloalkaliphila TaxID=421628 RepID=W8L9R8_9GAMM|nr:hypothetical protein [Ectothiorhodospira haloalkaliphila]AHK80560.1 hypothetical protein M911_01585 [Ectothiorhodospira haloalkaliphila]
MLDPIAALDALPDGLLKRSGINPTAAHPDSDACARMDLAELARLTGELVIARDGRPRPASDHAVMSMGMLSTDYLMGMSRALERLMVRQFDVGTEHRRFCARKNAPDFRPVELPTADLGDGLHEQAELSEVRHDELRINRGEVLKLRSFGTALKVSRRVIVNDQWDTLAEAFSALGGSAGRLEGRMVYDALENTDTLADGEPVFHADHGNRVESALTKAGLSQAMAALRTMKINLGRKAEPANMTARHLVVSAASELEANELLHTAGLEYNGRQLVTETGAGVSVTATPHLPAGRWYLLPDPTVFPVVAVLSMNDRGWPITVGPTRLPSDRFDGIALKFLADLGVGMVSRLAIRGGE